MVRLIICCLAFLSLGPSCKSPSISNKSPGQIPFPIYLSVGSFGGFTGDSHIEFLMSDGKVFEQNGKNADKIFRHTANKDSTNSVFELALKIDWNNVSNSDFGNMNYFLQFQTSDTTYEVIWGSKGPVPPAEIKDLYDLLYQTIHSTR